MSLTRSQYDAVMRLYDRRQFENHQIEEDRRRRAYTAIPELSSIDAQLADEALGRLRRSLSGEGPAGGQASPKSPSPEDRKKALLLAHGFPADYLDPVYTCPDCRDTGFIGRDKCHCFRQAVIDLFYTQSGLTDVLKRENFSTFSLDWYPDDLIDPDAEISSRTRMEKILSTCRRFAAEYDAQEKPYLLLSGEPGLGKTFLSNCIAGELLASGHSVLYYSAKNLFDRLASVHFRSDRTGPGFGQPDADFGFDPDYLLTTDLLIIDDLGTELVNDFTRTEFFSLLNSRIMGGRGIVISTNYNWQELSDIYSPRIISRLMENFKLLSFFGADIRSLKRMKDSPEA